MRIALLAHSHHRLIEPFAGGLEAHTHLVADELVRRGHQVTLFAKAGSRTRAELCAIVPRRFRRRSAADDAVLDRGLARAIALIEAGDFDVVLNNSLNPAPWEALGQHVMLTLLHTPATLDRVNAVIERPGWQPGFRHGFAAVSEVTRADWQARLPGVEIDVVPNGVDLALWSPAPAPVHEPDLAVWAARITPEKGLPMAVAAARAAGFRLEIGGPIADRVHFERDIVPLLGDDVRYVGHLDSRELPGLLRRGAVFVSSPEWPEPFGLAMVEAMACGTPTAAVPRGAAAEVVSAAGGVLASDTSTEALAAAIVDAARLDRAGVRRSVTRFGKDAMVDAYEARLHALCDQSTTTDLLVNESVA